MDDYKLQDSESWRRQFPRQLVLEYDRHVLMNEKEQYSPALKRLVEYRTDIPEQEHIWYFRKYLNDTLFVGIEPDREMLSNYLAFENAFANHGIGTDMTRGPLVAVYLDDYPYYVKLVEAFLSSDSHGYYNQGKYYYLGEDDLADPPSIGKSKWTIFTRASKGVVRIPDKWAKLKTDLEERLLNYDNAYSTYADGTSLKKNLTSEKLQHIFIALMRNRYSHFVDGLFKFNSCKSSKDLYDTHEFVQQQLHQAISLFAPKDKAFIRMVKLLPRLSLFGEFLKIEPVRRKRQG